MDFKTSLVSLGLAVLPLSTNAQADISCAQVTAEPFELSEYELDRIVDEKVRYYKNHHPNGFTKWLDGKFDNYSEAFQIIAQKVEDNTYTRADIEWMVDISMRRNLTKYTGSVTFIDGKTDGLTLENAIPGDKSSRLIIDMSPNLESARFHNLWQLTEDKCISFIKHEFNVEQTPFEKSKFKVVREKENDPWSYVLYGLTVLGSGAIALSILLPDKSKASKPSETAAQVPASRTSEHHR